MFFIQTLTFQICNDASILLHIWREKTQSKQLRAQYRHTPTRQQLSQITDFPSKKLVKRRWYKSFSRFMISAKMSRKKGPVFAKLDENDHKQIKEKQENGGLSKKTKVRRQGAMNVFDKCQLLNHKPTLKELCDARDQTGLEIDLQGFFQSYYVFNSEKVLDEGEIADQNDLEDNLEENSDDEENDDEENDDEENDDKENDDKENDDKKDLLRPKGNTAKTYKSHLKMLIKDFTKSEFDITNNSQFPAFNVS